MVAYQFPLVEQHLAQLGSMCSQLNTTDYVLYCLYSILCLSPNLTLSSVGIPIQRNWCVLAALRSVNWGHLRVSVHWCAGECWFTEVQEMSLESFIVYRPTNRPFGKTKKPAWKLGTLPDSANSSSSTSSVYWKLLLKTLGIIHN